MKDPLQFLPAQTPVADADGRMVPAFYRSLQLVLRAVGGWSAPEALRPQTLTASPWQFTAQQPGQLVVSGGTVSAVTLTRGATTITAPQAIYLSVGDVVTVNYSATPTVTFIPR